MGRGVHFSLDQLPERYRAQVMRATPARGGDAARAEKLDSVDDATTASQNAPKTAHKGFSHIKGKKSPSPIRLPRSKYKGPNKTEAQFNADFLFGDGKYEALTLHLPSGVKYTPDWLFEDDGDVYLVEVKGGYHLPTMGRSVMAFKIACEQFPMFGFIFAELCKDGRTWKVGIYKGGVLIKSVRGTAKELMGERFQ